MKLVLYLNSILACSAFRHTELKDLEGNAFETRKMQETVPEGGLCNTMIPPSPLAPDDSSCWEWYTPPPDGILPPGAPKPPTGCDYQPCEAAVCECDSYCCDTAWDLSCRGYYMKQGDTIENNYFVPGCSAKLLCCEQESAFPDPPIGAAMGNMNNAVSVPAPAFAGDMNKFACEPGSPGCCDTLKPPSFLPPDNSSCWQWWDPPADGVMKPGMAAPPKGCDYKPCQDAVCACDSYCCDTAWDLSCRGYHLKPSDTVDNNYFHDGCSAKMLCCEPESAYPDPPVGGALGSKTTTVIAAKKETTVVAVPQKVTEVKVVPVATVQKVPVQVTKVVPTVQKVPVQVTKVVPATTTTSWGVAGTVGAGSKSTYNVGVNVDQTNTQTTKVKKDVTVAAATVQSSSTITQEGKGGSKGSKSCGKSGKGKSGKSGKKSSKSKSSKSKSSKSSKTGTSKSKKSSKCPDTTIAPTPPVVSPTVSPTATGTSTSTSTSTATSTV